jgi:hypothetical protein
MSLGSSPAPRRCAGSRKNHEPCRSEDHRSDDASCLAGDEVNGPFSAYCEARVIDKHALEATEGLRYAELDREDPRRQVAQAASFLQASLFTSVVAFGVAAMAIAVGGAAGGD